MKEKDARSKLCPIMSGPNQREVCQGSRCMLWTYEAGYSVEFGSPYGDEEIRGYCGAFITNVNG